MKVITTTRTEFDLYSDGSRKNVKTFVSNQNDYSGFKATAAEMLPEAVRNAKTYSAEVKAVLDGTNKIRSENGAAALQLDENLTKAAMLRAVEMAYSGTFSHTRPDGTSCFSVFDTFGIEFGFCGENIAQGFTSASSVVNGWKNSEGHFSNMISKNFTKLGVGVIKVANGWWWVQLFTN